MDEEDWKESTLKILEDIRKDKKEEVSTKPFCLRCKKDLPKGSNLCPFCGHPLNDRGREILLEFCTNPNKKEE